MKDWAKEKMEKLEEAVVLGMKKAKKQEDNFQKGFKMICTDFHNEFRTIALIA